MTEPRLTTNGYGSGRGLQPKPPTLRSAARVYLAHVIALREFGTHEAVRRSQYPMLALMVGYTVVGLWIMAQPIVEAYRSISRARG